MSEKMNRPRLAVIVVAHSRPQTTAATIDAILSQSLEPNVVLLVANEATAGVLDVLEDKAAEHPSTEIMRLTSNGGAAGGFHAGIARACERGDIDLVCCFDDDALPMPGCLEALSEASKSLPRVGCVGPITETGDGSLSWPLHVIGQAEPLTTVAAAAAMAEPTAGALAVHAMSWHALMIPITVIREAGNVDADLFHQYEDAEFGLRLGAAGLNNYAITSAKCIHPPAPPARDVRIIRWTVRVTCESPAKEYLGIRNDLVVRRRYNGLRFWYGSLPLILLRGLLVCRGLNLSTATALRTVYFRAISDGFHERLGPPPASLS